MKVKALCNNKGYYALSEGVIYEVKAIIYFVTPFFAENSENHDGRPEFVAPFYSQGVIRNGVVYLIETVTTTGRRTLARFDAAKFSIVDASTPSDWIVRDIDWRSEVAQVRDQLDGTDYDVRPFDNALEKITQFNAKIISVGDTSIDTPEKVYAVCDDDVE